MNFHQNEYVCSYYSFIVLICFHKQCEGYTRLGHKVILRAEMYNEKTINLHIVSMFLTFSSFDEIQRSFDRQHRELDALFIARLI